MKIGKKSGNRGCPDATERLAKGSAGDKSRGMRGGEKGKVGAQSS